MLLMPSLYEPCGLTQLDCVRYGTIPIVRATGGLVDTVIDTTPETLADGTASGFHFAAVDGGAFAHAVERALEFHADGDRWQSLVRRVMQQDWSWEASAGNTSVLHDDLGHPADARSEYPDPVAASPGPPSFAASQWRPGSLGKP
jgi:starch synthase